MKTNIDSCLRLTIPIHIIRSLDVNSGEYAKIELRKGSLTDYLYLRIPSKPPSRKILQVRRKLPSSVVNNLQLTSDDALEIIHVEKISNESSKLCFAQDNFDLLSLQFENTMIETFTRNGEEWCRFWSSSKNGGLTNFIDLKRFIPINKNIGDFFGLMQAESSKKGQKLDFTNTLISEHKLFINTAEMFGIPSNAWKWGMIVNPDLSETDINRFAQKFSKKTGLGTPSYKTKSKTLISVAYQIYVSSSILSRLVNKSLIVLRKEIINSLKVRCDKNFEDFCKGFIVKYLLGDGTITFPSRSSAQIVLTEADAESRKDFQSMLRLFGINSSQQGIKIYVSTDFDSLLWFLKNNLFIGHTNNRKKLIDYALRNYYVKTAHGRLSKINQVSICEYAKLLDLPYNTANMSLHRYRKRGFLTSKKNGHETFFSLTEKGSLFVDVMRKIETEAASTFDISNGQELTNPLRNSGHFSTYGD